MRVIATKIGFYRGHRIRAGEEFEFDMDDAKRDVKRDENGQVLFERLPDGTQVPQRDPNKPMLPTWVVKASPEARSKYNQSLKDAAIKAREAALASAGPKRAKRGFASVPEAEDSTDIV